MVDTAFIYDGGKNEKYVGAVLQTTKIPREEIFVTTKQWRKHHGYEETKVTRSKFSSTTTAILRCNFISASCRKISRNLSEVCNWTMLTCTSFTGVSR